MLLRRLRDDVPFTPMNGVRPLPSVNSPVVPLPPVDDSFYRVRPLPPVVNPDAVRPLPPVDGGIRLASGQMPDYSSAGGFSPPQITFPDVMDDYADQSRQQETQPRRLDDVPATKLPSTPPVDQLGKGVTLDYEQAYNQYEGDGKQSVRQRMRQASAGPATRVGELAKMLWNSGVNPYYDPERGQYRGFQAPKLSNVWQDPDIERMAQRDYVESNYPRETYYPRRRA